MIASRRGRAEVLGLLLAKGVALDTVRSRGGAAFHYACISNQCDCAEALVRAGCDVTVEDSNGKTGQQAAEASGHTVLLARLSALTQEQTMRKRVRKPKKKTPPGIAVD